MKFVSFGALLFSLVAFIGCTDGGGATATAGAAVNSICPLMGGKFDGQTTVEWNGKTIGFCCPPCVDEWATMTDEERTQALADATVEKTHGDDEHHDHAEHSEAHHDHADHATDHNVDADAPATSEAESAQSTEVAPVD